MVALLITAEVVCAQEYVQRLKSPARVKGFIGGESHDSYVIRGRTGQVMTVRISWRPDDSLGIGPNHAEFWVGEFPNFVGDGAVKFGRETKGGRQWTGTIPRTKDYYIYVMAHPTAHYILKVTLK